MQEIIVHDQLKRKVKIPSKPKRIISLVPSQTELLFDLGLEDSIVGITKFCVHPKEKCKTKNKVGGTKKLNINKILDLQPDLIIANKEENLKEDIEILEKFFPVWISDIYTFDDALGMIISIGEITGTSDAAAHLDNSIKKKFEGIRNIYSERIIYIIWKNPLMAAGGKTFINSLIEWIGFKNIVTEERYPEITTDILNSAEMVFLSTEPYPFKDKHVSELQQIAEKPGYMIIDGEMFSWYGSRLLYFPDYIKSTFKDLRSSQK